MMENWIRQIKIAKDIWLDHINKLTEKNGANKTYQETIDWINRTYDYAFANGRCEQDSIRCAIELVSKVSPEMVTRSQLNRCGITQEDFDEYKVQHQQATEYLHKCEMAGLAEDIEDQRKEEAYINKHFRDIGVDKEPWE